MAMVKISNGEVTQIVSRGAFDTQYKRLGFQIVEDNKVAEVQREVKKAAEEKKPEVQVPDDDDFDADAADDTEDDFEELLEKPISQWNKTEVKDFAAAKGIDIHGTKNANEAKEIIKKYLDDEAKKAAEA
ncbi:MAG: hypothetical protein IJV29_02090 [Butyrivibrio sp.]|nr:hypothetical protein [Butyrivibrio sp.]